MSTLKSEGRLPGTFGPHHHPHVTYVFQGGGALGAYQVGAYEALNEHGYRPDTIVGVSIGAINASIIAGNKEEDRPQKLLDFWNRITTKIPLPVLPQLGFSKIHHWISAKSSLMFGQPGFFQPKVFSPWLMPSTTPDQLGIYDTSPLRETLLELVDFKYLNQKHIRLCIGAANLASGEFKFFDNTEEELTVEHIMASSALPPGFPPIKIGDDYYVDGGVYSNTPIFKVLDEFAESESNIHNVLCFMVDLFSISGVLPHSLDGILERVKDIRYSSHTVRTNQLYATTQNLSHAIHLLTSKLTKEQRSDPEVQKVLKLGFAHRLDLVHLVYHSERGTELESKDYEFSLETANKHWKMGYSATKDIIIREEPNWQQKQKCGVTIYNPS